MNRGYEPVVTPHIGAKELMYVLDTMINTGGLIQTHSNSQ